LKMKFTKMHGIGNDYVYMDCTRERLENPGEIARLVSDRHKGIGSDGLILIQSSDEADFEMAMYNADGSYGKMCGNGIRCVAKYVYDNGLTDKTEISVISGGAVKYLKLTVENGKVKKCPCKHGGTYPEAVRDSGGRRGGQAGSSSHRGGQSGV